ncbi:efflux RND transporter periplasmic adaptor subunit [Acinetobacter rudis]|uniref:Efflux RND transporter periplasmic adaptor subunit n=1 Tax=Acinetobacter rudis TaxID=632955 RepID=A0AAW8JFC1_9GAMM|nr:efflux RND transporter periplasmic adaptor subunit [Acinetobacter rudis]MDQ8936399.1 efflux RND transporter periplasmic adaptor subunit [Acinetobacter rudis]MDQ8952897.1 efflux RND transporter periplasmic adaptor subunit [Acinetobacter rudis]MDQ9018650.1 efflux RND transporter periplasmic adaptor subunit [Acinetobacter rudis]
MPKIKPIKALIILICIALIAALAWSYFKPQQKQPDYISSEVTTADLEDSVLATGTLQAAQIVSVGAQVSGQVKKMYVKLGDEVKQGQLIAQIDSVPQQNEFKTAEASIKNQKAQLAIKIANLAKVEAEYKRQSNMYSQDATSRAEYEAALAAFKTAQADIAASNAQIEQSYLTLATTKEKLGYTSIVAPISGTVVAIVTEEGQTVNSNQTAPTIVKLAKLDTMTIKAQISEADVMRVHQGQKVYFTTLGDSENKRYATLRQIEPAPDSINNDTKTTTTSNSSSNAIYYNALFDVPNTDGKLRIDMTAQVYIILAEAKNALTVPSAALQTSARGSRRTNAASAPDAGDKKSRNKDGKENDASQRPKLLELTADEKALIKQNKASLAMVRVLNDQGEMSRQQVLVGLNNRINAQILRGLKPGQKIVIADGSDASNDSAKRRGGSVRI